MLNDTRRTSNPRTRSCMLDAEQAQRVGLRDEETRVGSGHPDHSFTMMSA